MKRPPIGVSILAFLTGWAGFTHILIGLITVNVVIFGDTRTPDHAFLSGVLEVVLGLLYLGVGVGAWRLEPWAYTVGFFVSAFGIFAAVLVLLSTESLSRGLSAALFPLIVFLYLNRDSVRNAFIEGLDETPTAAERERW